jgi:hypothetical protein
VIQRKVHDNSIQPGTESRFTSERVHRSVRSHESFLGNLFGIIMIADEPVGDIVSLFHMAFNEAPKRFMTPLPGLLNQVLLVGSGHPEVLGF